MRVSQWKFTESQILTDSNLEWLSSRKALFKKGRKNAKAVRNSDVLMLYFAVSSTVSLRRGGVHCAGAGRKLQPDERLRLMSASSAFSLTLNLFFIGTPSFSHVYQRGGIFCPELSPWIIRVLKLTSSGALFIFGADRLMYDLSRTLLPRIVNDINGEGVDEVQLCPLNWFPKLIFCLFMKFSYKERLKSPMTAKFQKIAIRI